MLDITLLRKDLNSVVAGLEARKKPQTFLNTDAFVALETERKVIQARSEELQAERNKLSKQIGQLKAKGEAIDDLMAQVASVKFKLDSAPTRMEQIGPGVEDLLLAVPNLR